MFGELNWKSFMEACGGKVDVAAKRLEKYLGLPENDPMRLSVDDKGLSIRGLHEAVDPTQFATLVGVLLSKKIMDAYEAAPKILDQLVTPFTSTLETDRIPGAYVKGTLDTLRPGEPYPHTGDIGEKYVTVTGEKRGEILDITEEAVTFDQTGLVMLRAAQFGERAAMDREQRGLYTILDLTVSGTNYYAWYPSGTRSALWANAGGAGHAHEYDNLVVDTLEDWTDINAADNLLGLMKDDNGDAINVVPKILLVPRALQTTGRRIINNTVLPGAANVEQNPWANAVTVLSTSLIDGCGDGNAATMWYWGDFKKQFVEKVVYALQVLSRTDKNNEDSWGRDIVASYKVRHFTQVGAVDYRYVVKSTGAG
jgi:hypothetical protein